MLKHCRGWEFTTKISNLKNFTNYYIKFCKDIVFSHQGNYIFREVRYFAASFTYEEISITFSMPTLKQHCLRKQPCLLLYRLQLWASSVIDRGVTA